VTDILGIGNALLDIFCFSEEETALSLGIHPNSTNHVSPDRLDELLLGIRTPVLVSGGSASNALKAASSLGLQCSFIGCTGTIEGESDRWALVLGADLASYGVHLALEDRSHTTGRCLIIHMPGALKSIVCAPGAAPSIRPEQITQEAVNNARIVMLDGQLLRYSELSNHICTLASQAKVPLALDIASVDIAKNHSILLPGLLTRGKTILFCNTDEAEELALVLADTVPGDRGFQTREELVHSVFSFYTARKRSFPCIVRKEGPLGATAWCSGSVIHREGQAIDLPLDDTGAGDVFAGAFLCAWLAHAPLEQALDFANKAGRSCLTVPGTRLDWDFFTTLKEELPVYQG